MSAASDSQPTLTLGSGVDAYYKLHARIYDATRWTFLLGRQALVYSLQRTCRPTRILEVGCGTGHNLALLGKAFPNATLVGVDLSADMLAIAHRKLGPLAELRQQRYDRPLREGFDLVVCSYALSMFNPGWDEAIDHIREELIPGGYLGIVDFHGSPSPLFRRWMGMNHVRMDAHLLPKLEQHFAPVHSSIPPAAAGLWNYLLFIGQPKTSLAGEAIPQASHA